MSSLWARIRLLLARVHKPAHEIGLPNQGLQILFDNLTGRGHGLTVASIDVATRPGLRARMAAEITTDQLDRAVIEHAHTNNWIECDASRTGDSSVGRRGAGPRGRRMRRDCPNDRRPTRSAANGSVTCRHAGERLSRLRAL